MKLFCHCQIFLALRQGDGGNVGLGECFGAFKPHDNRPLGNRSAFDQKQLVDHPIRTRGKQNPLVSACGPRKAYRPRVIDENRLHHRKPS